MADETPLSPLDANDENQEALGLYQFAERDPQKDVFEDYFKFNDGIDNSSEPYDGVEEHKPHQQPTETPVSQPSVEPLAQIGKARHKLIDEISQNADKEWKNEKNWTQMEKHGYFEKQVKDILDNERLYLGPSDSDKYPTNLLQHVLVNATRLVPYNERLHKAKFLLQLIADLEPNQLSPLWGPRPLHSAANFDIAAKADNAKLNDDTAPEPDLTIYTCNLMKEKAAEEIAQTNEFDENILHMAIRYELKGADVLIRKAHKTAFKQRRTSNGQGPNSQFEDGNTPLHDALAFKYFWVPGPRCLVPAKPKSTARTGAEKGQVKEVRRSSVAAGPGSETQQSLQVPIANQAKARDNAATPAQGGPAQIVYTAMCPTCLKALEEAMVAAKERKNIIDSLLAQDMEALTVHNSSGLSPYLYLHATRQNFFAGEKKTPRGSSTTPGPTPPPTSAVTRAANQQMTNDPLDRDELERRDKLEKKSGGGASARKNTFHESQIHEEGTGASKPGNGSHQPVGAVKGPVKNKQVIHSSTDLQRVTMGFDGVSKQLMDSAFRLGGYKKAYKCLFRDQSAKNPSPFEGEVDRQRRFSLEGNQRVSSDTKAQFNFLIFETMLASVTLSLEYTQEQLEALPSEKDRAVKWQDDEKNLKEVFRWLKVDKKVKTIVNLTVKDNTHHYCTDETVEECLKGLDVRYLDWNRPDLCAETLRVSPSLVEISLYWTGLNAVLWSWSDTEGLLTLAKLQKVHLYIQRGVELRQKQDDKVAAFRKRVNNWRRTLKPEIISRDDNRQLKGDVKGNGLNLNRDIPIHSWLQTASKFSTALSAAMELDKSPNKPCCRVKVALLDDGVDPTYDHIGQNLHHAGWPSVESGELKEGGKGFYVSTNQHGSKMAWLIRKVFPDVTICVAKLDVENSTDLRHRSFNLQQATKAIKWAIDQKVDIISMSWNARQVPGETGNVKDIEDLENAIALAGKKILMFGAACDVKESSSTDKWYPCDFDKVRSIGATDIDFDVKKYVNMNKKVDYLFPGEQLLGRPGDQEVGNSGATALASGLAALVLSCMKIGRIELPEDKQTWMDNIMTKVFNSDRNAKVVHVKHVLQRDEMKPVWNELMPLIEKFAAQKG